MEPTRMARRREQTRDEILAVAERLALDGDPEAVTVQAVARALGVSPGALYRYFPSRDAILAAVQARVVDELATAVDTALTASFEASPAGACPVGRILAAGRALLGYAATSPNRYALLSRMLAVPRPILADDVVAPAIGTTVRLLGRLVEVFEAARVAGELAPGDDFQRVMVYWAAVHGAVQLDKLGRFAPIAGVAAGEAAQAGVISASAVGQAAIMALLRGWGASDAALAAGDLAIQEAR